MTSADSIEWSDGSVWELAVTVAPELIELTSDLLWSLGATAVEERADGERCSLVVALPDERTGRSLLTALTGSTGWRDSTTVTLREREIVLSESWRDHARWHRITPDLAVGPWWVEPPPNRHAIAIEPAGSFGLGDHPTTGLSLGDVWQHVRVGDRVVDLGAGSGVLSIAAAIRGASTVHAIDISPVAVGAAQLNIDRAGFADVIDVHLDGSGASAVEAFGGEADLLVANILAPELTALADTIDAAVGPRGLLVLSGFPESRIDSLLAAFPGWREARRRVRGKWSSLSLRRR